MGVGGQRHALAALPPGKTRYPLCRRLGGPRAGLDECGKSCLRPGFDRQTLQPVASRYTDWAIPARSNACNGPHFIPYDSGQQNIPRQPSDVIRASLRHESSSDSLLSLPSAYCCYLPSIKIREDHRVWYGRTQTGSTDPHRVAGGTRVYTLMTWFEA